MLNESVHIDVLDQEGALLLAKGILDKVNVRIAQRIVQTLDPSDTKHVPSAAAVIKAINAQRHASIKTITGDINVVVPIEERSTSILYFQRDNEEDTTWMIYIWNADPTLDVDPDGSWICLGDTEIDLSGYWSKSEADISELSTILGVDTLKTQVITINNNIDTLIEKTDAIDGSLEGVMDALDEKINRDELVRITAEIINNIMDYVEGETDPFAQEASSVDDVIGIFENAAVSGKTNITVELSSSLDLTTAASKVIDVPAGMKVNLKIPEGTEVKCDTTAFTVQPGGNLILTGEGTISDECTDAKGAIRVEEGGALTINGITLDCVSKQGVENNWCYGVYAKKGSTINFVDGTIKVGAASCISTNYNTGGSTINVYGGELLSEACYAIYVPAQSDVNIYGGTVQGISARMGKINISGDAKIISTALNSSNAVSIGANVTTTGSVELGDTIAIMAGTYVSGEKNTDCVLSITENAKVESSCRSAIGVYSIDTKEGPQVTINVAKANAISTTDTAFDPITVYDHSYIDESATTAGKKYTPVAQSDIHVTVAGKEIYPTA